VAATGDQFGGIWLSDPETLRPLAQLRAHDIPPTRILDLAFSADGKTLALAGGDKTIQLWDVGRKEEMLRLKGHEGPVTSVAFSPDGQLLLSGSTDKTVRVWDVAAGKEVGRYSKHTTPVDCVAVSPDGKRALSGGGQNEKGVPVDCELRLWDVATGQELGKLKGHTDHVSCIAWSPNGQLVLSTSVDQTLRWWNPNTGEQVRAVTSNAGQFIHVSCSPDGHHALASQGAGSVQLLDTKNGQVVRSFNELPPLVCSRAVFFPDSSRALLAFEDTLLLWDTKTGKNLRPLVGHTAAVKSIAFSQDGRYLLSGSHDATVRLWDLERRQDLGRFAPTDSLVGKVALSPQARYALGSTFGAGAPTPPRFWLWDVASGKGRQLPGHEGFVGWMAFLAEDGQALTAGNDGTLRRWEVESGKDRVLQKFGSLINGAVLSPDGNRVLLRLGDDTLHLWDLKENTEVGVWSSRVERAGVTSMTFAADGRRLYAGLSDRKMVVCGLPPAKPEWSQPLFHWDAGAAWALALAPGGKVLAVAADSGLVILWDTTTFRKVCEWKQPGVVHDLAFAPDGRLATANSDGTIDILRLTPPGR
jgi:WD40 repeat protein